MRSTAGLAALSALVFSAIPARAADLLMTGEPRLDPPTLITLGVVLPISGDDDHDASVSVRYRVSGTTEWLTAHPLERVHSELVVTRAIAPQFAGSIFELYPDTSYDIELHAVDPDGLDETRTLTGRTRAVPGDPASPHSVDVSDAQTLQAALDAAQPGDVIQLADGTYSGQFTISASGTADAPIVIRGSDAPSVILDGAGATGNVLEVYGSFVHIERLSIRNAQRALRFQGTGAEGNVVRRVVIEDVVLGIGAQPDQRDFYICDNELQGRLSWPAIYSDDGGAHANDDGILVMGTGHVVCHNTIRGFGDAMKTEQAGARGLDFYGNETLSAYDNALELDESEGNVRAFRNRFTNSYAPLSYQPIYGGPAYAFRNVVVNVVDEQNKLHSLGGTDETVGSRIYNNTFVSYGHAMQCQTTATAHDFQFANNLFVGPETLADGRTVNFTAPIDLGFFDYDGYYPDGRFDFDAAGDWPTFSDVQAAGIFETHGVLLDAQTFASALVGPADYRTELSPQDVTLSTSSRARDRGKIIANVTDHFQGAAPDLGALEADCPQPIYGPRPNGVDETNEPIGCVSGGGAGTGGAPGTGGSNGTSGTSGTAGTAGSGGSSGTATGGTGAQSGAAGRSGNAAPSEEEGGCSCRAARSSDPFGGRSLLGALMLLALFRRQVRAQKLNTQLSKPVRQSTDVDAS